MAKKMATKKPATKAKGGKKASKGGKKTAAKGSTSG